MFDFDKEHDVEIYDQESLFDAINAHMFNLNYAARYRRPYGPGEGVDSVGAHIDGRYTTFLIRGVLFPHENTLLDGTITVTTCIDDTDIAFDVGINEDHVGGLIGAAIEGSFRRDDRFK